MARKKTTVPDDPNAGVNTELLQEDTKKFDELQQRLQIIEEQYGDGSPFELDKSIAKTQIYMAASAESLLMAGKELIRIKEHTPHGEFQDIVEKTIGINPHTARRMMAAAVKFLGTAPRKALAHHLGASKLLELVTEDDAELDALAEGGTLAGFKIDEIDAMPVRDLRAALKQARDKLKHAEEIHSKQLARKDDKINQLDKQLHSREHTDRWHTQAFGVCTEITEVSAEILQGVDRLNALRETILTADFGDDKEAAINAMAVVYYDAIHQLFDNINQLAHDCHEVFSGYKQQARPLIDMEEVFGQQAQSATSLN